MKLITLTLLVNEDVLKGKGSPEDPNRRCVQVETLDGIVIFAYDQFKDQVSMTANMIDVIRDAPRELLTSKEPRG